jgi:hypothetical protein
MGPDLSEWRRHLAGGFIVAVLAHLISIALYTRLLKRRNLQGDRVAGATLLRYSVGWHLFAWTALVLPMTGLSWLVWKFPPKPDDVVPVVSLFATFGLVGTYLVLQVSCVAHELRSDGLLRVTPWGPRCFLPWTLVTEVRYSDLMTGWRIRTVNGDSAWVWLALSGAAAFAQAVLENVPAEAIARDSKTRSSLAGHAGR